MKKSGISDLILQCSCVTNSNDSDILAANSTKFKLLTCWRNSNNYFFPPIKGGSKLNLKLSFETKSYIWALSFFSFHVVSLFLSYNNLWIKPWHVHTYGLFIICLCTACYFLLSYYERVVHFLLSNLLLSFSHGQILSNQLHKLFWRKKTFW